MHPATHILQVPTYRLPSGQPGRGSQEVKIPVELKVLSGTEQPSPGSKVFRVLTVVDGDKRVTWNADSLGEINAAKKMFRDLVKQGLVPYKVGSDGRPTSKVMKEFDPGAEEIIFVPVGVVGGG
jgi:hypothetical protein